MRGIGGRLRTGAVLVVTIALIAAGCGADDSSSTEAELISQAAGTLGDVDLSLVVAQAAQGFGSLDRSQQQIVQGLADGGATCDNRAGSRARPQPSQVEVEIVTVVEGCLQISYDVANFRSLVADLRRFRRVPDVVAVSPLLLEYRLDQIEADWTLDAIAGPAAQLTGLPTGADAIIAVIDSGIDTKHPSLRNASITRAPDSGTGDYTANGHGTIAAAIMVAPISNSRRGVAPRAQLLDVPADLCGPDDCGCDPCAVMTAAEAIRWSTDNGADIISMSFGYQPAEKPAWWQILLDNDEISSATETIEVALGYASASGVAMAAAAGNCATGPNKRCEAEDQFEIPAGHPDVIGVGATSLDDEGNRSRAWYSTRQPYVELAAPGSVRLALEGGETLDKLGTSYANPLVAAALAMLMGSDGPLHDYPNRSVVARNMLFDSAVDLEPVGRDNESGHGQLQIAAAISVADTYRQENPLPEPDERDPDESDAPLDP